MNMQIANNKMEVSAIKNGTVIDHIPPTALFKVIELLNLDSIDVPLFFATNLDSKKIGKKALIKIVDTYCSDYDISYLALVAPAARISTIKDYKVVEKRQIEPPKEVTRFVKCANPMCITNHEKIKTRFNVNLQNGELLLKCGYCEQITMQEQIEIIKGESKTSLK